MAILIPLYFRTLFLDYIHCSYRKLRFYIGTCNGKSITHLDMLSFISLIRFVRYSHRNFISRICIYTYIGEVCKSITVMLQINSEQ